MAGRFTRGYKPSNTNNAQSAALTDTPIAVQTESIPVTDKGIILNRTSKGDVKKANKTVQFTVTSLTLNSVDLSNWNGETSTIAATWHGATNVPVVTGSFKLPTSVTPGNNTTILTVADSTFYDKNISGVNKYGSNLGPHQQGSWSMNQCRSHTCWPHSSTLLRGQSSSCERCSCWDQPHHRQNLSNG